MNSNESNSMGVNGIPGSTVDVDVKIELPIAAQIAAIVAQHYKQLVRSQVPSHAAERMAEALHQHLLNMNVRVNGLFVDRSVGAFRSVNIRTGKEL